MRVCRQCLSLTLGALIALLLLVVSAPVIAHGGGTPRLTDAEAGPYRIFAWTEPEPWRAGEVHVSVMLTLAPPADAEADERTAANRLDEPVNDAEVAVSFVPMEAEGDPITLPTELQSLGGNISYEVDTTLPSDGIWRVEIVAHGDEGGGDASFEVDVRPSRTLNMWLLAGGALLIVAFLGILVLRRR